MGCEGGQDFLTMEARRACLTFAISSMWPRRSVRNSSSSFDNRSMSCCRSDVVVGADGLWMRGRG